MLMGDFFEIRALEAELVHIGEKIDWLKSIKSIEDEIAQLEREREKVSVEIDKENELLNEIYGTED